jgi:hypothetical protein
MITGTAGDAKGRKGWEVARTLDSKLEIGERQSTASNPKRLPLSEGLLGQMRRPLEADAAFAGRTPLEIPSTR